MSSNRATGIEVGLFLWSGSGDCRLSISSTREGTLWPTSALFQGAKLLGLDTAKIYREIWCRELRKIGIQLLVQTPKWPFQSAWSVQCAAAESTEVSAICVSKAGLDHLSPQETEHIPSLTWSFLHVLCLYVSQNIWDNAVFHQTSPAQR